MYTTFTTRPKVLNVYVLSHAGWSSKRKWRGPEVVAADSHFGHPPQKIKTN